MDPSAGTKAHIKVVDVETTQTEGSPDWALKANKVVLWGCYDPDYLGMPFTTNDTTDFSKEVNKTPNRIMFVGHSLMFDCGYMLRDHVIAQDSFALYCSLWDTQIVEYILSGQKDKFITLEDLATKYGVAFTKDPDISAHFTAGLGADTVPHAKLKKYLRDDLLVTYQIFLKQYQLVLYKGMLPLVEAMMDARQATIECRINGMRVDQDKLAYCAATCRHIMHAAQARAEAVALSLHSSARITDWEKVPFEILKPQQLAKFLWGGEHKYTERVPDGHYKNGNPKLKTEHRTIKYRGIVEKLYPLYTPGFQKGADEGTLEQLVSHIRARARNILQDDLRLLIEAVLEYRKAAKIEGTYVHPTANRLVEYGEPYVRPTIHTCTTNTGRTSCADPNLQNVPKNSVGDYRKVFTSRYPGGMIGELDYSQLEVVALALLSGDKNLMADIHAGIDIHTKLYGDVHGCLPGEEERRQFKRAVFALIYGGGPKTVADRGNTTKATAQRLIDSWAARYPETMEFRKRVKQLVTSSSIVAVGKKEGMPYRVGKWVSPTKRVYRFEQRLGDRGWGKSRHKEMFFSDQEMANYPIQGTATADMVPLMVGYLYRNIYKLNLPCKLVMMVHDSVVLDIKAGHVNGVMKICKRWLEELPSVWKGTFGLECGLPFKVGVSVGHNWNDMKELTVV